MTSKHLLTALVAVPCLMALEPRADEVHFAPSEGSSLKKTFGIEFSLALGDLTMIANGMDASGGIPADLEVFLEIAMTVVDTYDDMEAEKPLDLIRLYDSRSLTWETPNESSSGDEEFEGLAGKQVRFQWNGDTETYAVTYHESEGEQEWIEGLGVDMDLRSMLPEGEVSEGDTWTLAAEQVVPLLFLGAELDELSLDLEDDPEGIGALLESELRPQIESLLDELVAECTYAGRREVDGATMGAIDLQIKNEGTLDLSGMLLQLIEIQTAGVPAEVDIDEAVVTVALDGEGTLVWDLEGGHLHSFELSPELEILIDVSLSIDVSGETQDFEASVELLGSGNWTAAVVE
jgi:hypothetical protein